MKTLALLSTIVFTASTALAQSAQSAVSFFADFERFDESQLAFSLADVTLEYQHGVFGDDFEFASLLAPDGSVLFQPQRAVLEDRVVRVMDLNHDGLPEILLTEANPRQGANLVLLELGYADDGTWVVNSVARGPAIGRGFRWMNPLEGQVDFDFDGVDEIAAMTTPHIGGPVVVYKWRGGRLEPFRRIDVSGYSNHRFGDPEQRWSRFFRRDDGVVVAELRDRRNWTATKQFEVE